MTIRARQPEDLDSVRALLAAADLPSNGLERTEGWVAEANGRLLGHVALERTVDAAVLRSLAVAPSARGQGLARRLMDLAEAEAGHRTLLLKTSTIGPWAERRGYFRANPDQMPESVRGTTEFEGALCSGYPAYMKPAVELAANSSERPDDDQSPRKNGKDDDERSQDAALHMVMRPLAQTRADGEEGQESQGRADDPEMDQPQDQEHRQ